MKNQQAFSHIAQGGKQKNLVCNRGMNYELDISQGLKTPVLTLARNIGRCSVLVAEAGGGLHAVKNIRYCLRCEGGLHS